MWRTWENPRPSPSMAPLSKGGKENNNIKGVPQGTPFL